MAEVAARQCTSQLMAGQWHASIETALANPCNSVCLSLQGLPSPKGLPFEGPLGKALKYMHKAAWTHDTMGYMLAYYMQYSL
jgi:hypothetical protein